MSTDGQGEYIYCTPLLSGDEIQRQVELTDQPLGTERLSAGRALPLLRFALALALARLRIVIPFRRQWSTRIRVQHLTSHTRPARKEWNHRGRGRGRHHARCGPRCHRRIVRQYAPARYYQHRRRRR